MVFYGGIFVSEINTLKSKENPYISVMKAIPLPLTIVRVEQVHVSIGCHLYTTFTSNQSGKGFHCFRKSR